MRLLRHRLRQPCRRTADCAAIGQRYLVRQLATPWRVLRNVPVQRCKLLQFIASAAMWVVNRNWLLQLVSDCRDGSSEVGIAADQCKRIDIIVKHCVEDHFSGYVDIGSFLFEFDDRSHAIRFVAGDARFFEEGHLDLVLCVKAFDYLNSWQSRESFKVVVLSKKLVVVVRECLYSRGEIFYRNDLDVVGDNCIGELLKIKPFVGSAFQHPVEQVKTVYVYVNFHCVLENAKAGLPRPCAASAVPWRVDVGIIPNISVARKGAKSESERSAEE